MKKFIFYLAEAVASRIYRSVSLGSAARLKNKFKSQSCISKKNFQPELLINTLLLIQQQQKKRILFLSAAFKCYIKKIVSTTFYTVDDI